MVEDLDTIEVGDIVNFNPYPEQDGRVGTLGKVKRIGTAEELGMFDIRGNDDRLFYELESLPKYEGASTFIFTRTTERWITKVEK